MFRQLTLGDVDLFLLDDRFHRAPNAWPAGPDKTALGAAQRDWLKGALVTSRATFKLVVCGNQLLNRRNAYESLQGFPADLDPLLAWIGERRIEGVVFVSGDRHHSELLRDAGKGRYPLYELTCSPLTARTFGFEEDHPEAENPQRVEGTLVQEHNYGMIRVSGPRRDRTLTVEVRGRGGEVLWTRAIARRELSFPAEDEAGR